MSITVHLVVPGRWQAEDLLREGDPRGVVRWVRQPRLDLDFGCVAVGTFVRHDRPLWSRMLESHFDIDWPFSTSSSVVLLAEVADRWFAVTFGQGRHLLRQDLLVADFGLRATANTLRPDRVRSLSSVLLDVTNRTTAQKVSVPSTLGRFSVDLDGEWIRSLGGWTDDHLSRGMTGSQSLSIDLGPKGLDLGRLHELLKYLLASYEDVRYREHFGFIDLVVPLHPDDRRVPELDAAVERLLGRAGRDVGLLAPQSQPGDEVAHSYAIRVPGSRRYRSFDPLGVRLAAEQAVNPLRINVVALDVNGQRIGSPRPLREFLSAEITMDGGWFVLSEGRWFQADPERLAQLDRELEGVPEFGHKRLDMPLWVRRNDEGAYNVSAAQSRRWRLMDKDLFLGEDRRHDRVEICDLLTDAMDMICVKRHRDASSLSHLFSQGSVSAALYRSDADYRSRVHDAFVAQWPDIPMPTPTIVYAIGTDRPSPLRKTLPLFSRVNLRNHAVTIRNAGLGVAVIRVVPTEFRDIAAVVVPDQPTSRTGQLDLF